MKRIFSLFFAFTALSAQASEEMVSVPFVNWNGKPEQLEMRISKPAANTAGDKKPAVVVLHHGGGWDTQTTKQYATLLNGAGYITAETVMFRSRMQPSHFQVPKVFATLKHLASLSDVDPSRIAVMGLSAGAFQSIYAVSDWATKKYGDGHKFASSVAFYPACWIIKKSYQNDLGRFKNSNYPDDFLNKFTGAPLTILAGGKDDYDNKKPTMCADAVDLMPDAKQKSMTKVHVFENATHGWDHGQTYSFHEPLACEGRGCTNTNQSDPATTEAGKSMLLNILRDQLKPQ
ncbi:dienelactone hydrolase family protein [Limnohabitans sp. G3-2]|uniref:dienelactone hydrolase family protein n=1 Tax=Limnohabitans sp. G3-2 TaxID=1100711 RepID=UPI001304212C|nr:alpha/beta hydrolase fold domain-containing protein [Limnohabitans sp. G3-2]